MSWEVYYYIGVKDDTGKIRPVVRNLNGEITPVRITSRSFTTDLPQYFYKIEEEDKDILTEEFIKKFTYTNYNDEQEFSQYVGYLPFSELPKEDFIKSGYFLREDISIYIRENDSEGLFYESLSPIDYAMKVESELKFGKQPPKRDCEGNKLETYSCADYAYFCYPDYHCEEYEAFLFKTIAYAIEDELPTGWEYVVVKDEG